MSVRSFERTSFRRLTIPVGGILEIAAIEIGPNSSIGIDDGTCNGILDVKVARTHTPQGVLRIVELDVGGGAAVYLGEVQRARPNASNTARLHARRWKLRSRATVTIAPTLRPSRRFVWDPTFVADDALIISGPTSAREKDSDVEPASD